MIAAIGRRDGAGGVTGQRFARGDATCYARGREAVEPTMQDSDEPLPTSPDLLTFAGFVIDPGGRVLTGHDGLPVPLTPSEVRLLRR